MVLLLSSSNDDEYVGEDNQDVQRLVQVSNDNSANDGAIVPDSAFSREQ